MIRTWLGDCSKLKQEEVYQRAYLQVPLWRREKADRISGREHQAQSIGAWLLLEKVRRQYKIPESAVYNISHSDDYVLCSIDDSNDPNKKVGCDIQKMKELRQRVAERFFCESELSYIRSQETEQKTKEAFYRFWTLKESFMKATRLGMKLGLDTFEIDLEGTEGPRLVRQPENIKETYYYKEYIKEDFPYKIAVCSTTQSMAPQLETIDLAQ